MVCQETTRQRAEQGAAYRAGRQCPQRPAAFMARDLGGNQGVGVGNKAAQQAEQRAQQQKLPDILRHPHQHHDDGHPEG